MIFMQNEISESPDLIPWEIILIEDILINMNNCFTYYRKLKQGSVNCLPVL